MGHTRRVSNSIYFLSSLSSYISCIFFVIMVFRFCISMQFFYLSSFFGQFRLPFNILFPFLLLSFLFSLIVPKTFSIHTDFLIGKMSTSYLLSSPFLGAIVIADSSIALNFKVEAFDTLTGNRFSGRAVHMQAEWESNCHYGEVWMSVKQSKDLKFQLRDTQSTHFKKLITSICAHAFCNRNAMISAT